MQAVKHYGQVFTPPNIVAAMLALRRRAGRVLEPSCGNGAFMTHLQPDNTVGIELDAEQCPAGCLNIDFFDYPTTQQFDTIVGNPPYVRYQDILPNTKNKLDKSLFDDRSNLYLFFIQKCIQHLKPQGELIFITPRDFLKATASRRLNKWLYEQGTITHLIDLGDTRIFGHYTPNCVIWRFEKDCFERLTNEQLHFSCWQGQLLFTEQAYSVAFNELFAVRVGAVSGADRIFTHPTLGNTDFVCSTTAKTGNTRRMIFGICPPYLAPYKTTLLRRKVRHFDERNWWQWGRLHHQSTAPRLYVNVKTRHRQPFFLHPSTHYDGSVLAIFPHQSDTPLQRLCDLLNETNWQELGFVCDGRYIFSQRSLQNTLLPAAFASYLPAASTLKK